MAKKNILLISHEMSYTGAPNVFKNICRILIESGHAVSVWTLQNGEFTAEFEKLSVKVETINYYTDQEKIKNDLTRFDLVIANTIFCTEIAYFAQNIVKTILYIQEAHNIPELIRNCNINEDHFRKIRYTICVSKYAKSFIRENYNLNPKIICNYVDDCYVTEKKVREVCCVNFIIAGTVEYRKGFDVAIEAFNAMPEEVRFLAKLNLMGNIPDWSKDYWEKLKTSLINSQIVFHGEVKDNNKKFDIFSKMDVFVVASRDESCSLVALEGAMLGKPIVVTKNVGAKYLVNRKNGYIVETSNVEALSKVFHKMIFMKPIKRYQMGMAARKAYLKNASYKKFKINILRVVGR